MQSPVISEQLVQAIRAVAGVRPIRARRIEQGYTVAERWVVQLENGESVFVKAASDQNTARWLREELHVYQGVAAEFMPRLIGWHEAEHPLLVLQDLSAGSWSWCWSMEEVQQVLGLLRQLASTPAPADIPPLTHDSGEFVGWQEIARSPTAFLALGMVTPGWLERALPVLVAAETSAPFAGDALVHMDVRSDNLCQLGAKTYLVDWNWARRGNPALDLIGWLPSVYAEGGPAPWELTLEHPELISAVAGFYAARAPMPAHPQGPAIRQLQRRILASALPWAVKALGLPPPGSSES